MKVSAWCVCLAAAWTLCAGVPRDRHEALQLFAPASYRLDTTVLLNDVARKDKEVGYKIVAELDVVPVWSLPPSEFVLKFQLKSPKLHLRGSHVLAEFMPHESVWDSYADSIFYAHWKNGVIQNTYLDPDELVDVVNYKKALASLFQFQVLDGEYNETDVSGPCTVLYETISMNVFRKIKRRCSGDESRVVSGARRVVRYTLSAELDALDELYADELLELGLGRRLGVKARAWSRLTRSAARPAADAPRPAGPGPGAALAALPAALRPLGLELAPAPPDPDDQLDDEAVLRAVEQAEAGAEAGAAAEAAALGGALGALRGMARARVAALLARAPRPALARALGLAASPAAHAALAAFAQLAAPDPLLPLARAYLEALALALRPDAAVVRAALRLGHEARAPAVADAALLSASAAAARLADDELARAVRDSLARSLPRCKDAACRGVRLAALGNLRRADTADLLLQHAERGAAAEPHAAVLALQALGAAPAAALTFAHLDRLAALALDPRGALDVRAAALELLARRRARLPAPLAPLAHALHASNGSLTHELRRVLWQRLAALAPRHPELRRLPALLPPELRGWDAQAHAGSSSVLVRPTGWEAGGWSAELESVQVARGGLMRRGVVTLRALAADAELGSELGTALGTELGAELDVLAVHVWTRGLEAFGGDGADAGEAEDAAPAEDAAAGLAFTVGGARMQDIMLFNGQAELLGHVWAGTASSPTPALRALQLLADERAAPALQAGVRVRARAAAALALALDASAQVSLWQRTARAALELRAGATQATTAALAAAWTEASAAAHCAAEARLRVAADLDLLGATLCVRAATGPLERRRRVELLARAGARRLRRRRRLHVLAPGRTLALGAPNDLACRTLRSADDEQPDA